MCKSCSVQVCIATLVLNLGWTSSIAKKSAALTGPVMTLLDLVVHVPVNCGSVFADTKDVSTAPAPSDNGRDRIMKCGCWDVSSVSSVEFFQVDLGSVVSVRIWSSLYHH